MLTSGALGVNFFSVKTFEIYNKGTVSFLCAAVAAVQKQQTRFVMNLNTVHRLQFPRPEM